MHLEKLLQIGSNNHEITSKLVHDINCGTSELKEFYQLVVNKNLLNLYYKMPAYVYEYTIEELLN